MAAHVIETTHIQHLIANGLDLAKRVHGKEGGDMIGLQPHQGVEGIAHELIAKAAADLRHAAEELEAERWSTYGFRQV